jgi:hypothetical protein
MRILAARFSKWRSWPPGTWAGWGRDRIISAGTTGLRGSLKYWLGIGPLLLWIMVPMTRRQIEEERKLIEPALRRISRQSKKPRRRRS